MYQTESSVGKTNTTNSSKTPMLEQMNMQTQGIPLMQPYYFSCPKATCEALQINTEHKYIA